MTALWWRRHCPTSPTLIRSPRPTASSSGSRRCCTTTRGGQVPIAIQTTEDDLFLGIAYRTVGRNVDFVSPEDPELAYRATFDPQSGLVPFTMIGSDGQSLDVKVIAGLQFHAVVKEAPLLEEWSRVAAGTIGDAEGWPKPTLEFKDGALDPALIYLEDPLQHWWTCSGCPNTPFHPSTIPSSASHLDIYQRGEIKASGFLNLGDYEGAFDVSRTTLSSDTDIRKFGFAIYLRVRPAPATQRSNWGWLDWQTATYRRLPLTTSPATVELSGAQTVTFSVTAGATVPAGTTWSWVLVTDAGRDSANTTVPTFSKQLPAGTVGTMRITAHAAGNGRPLGRVEVPIAAGAAPYWVITSITDQDQLLNDDENGAGGEAFDRIVRMVTVPQSGLIGVTRERQRERTLPAGPAE